MPRQYVRDSVRPKDIATSVFCRSRLRQKQPRNPFVGPRNSSTSQTLHCDVGSDRKSKGRDLVQMGYASTHKISYTFALALVKRVEVSNDDQNNDPNYSDDLHPLAQGAKMPMCALAQRRNAHQHGSTDEPFEVLPPPNTHVR